MLSQLKNYLFGATDGVLEPADCVPSNGGEDDWVLVDTQGKLIFLYYIIKIILKIQFVEVIGDLASEDGEHAATALEESWIVTQDVASKSVVALKSRGYGRRLRQPKGTKPRRWKGKTSNSGKVVGLKSVQASLEDNESTSSSIAIVPSPEPLNRPVATPVTAASVLPASADAKQMAAISSSRAVN